MKLFIVLFLFSLSASADFFKCELSINEPLDPKEVFIELMRECPSEFKTSTDERDKTIFEFSFYEDRTGPGGHGYFARFKCWSDLETYECRRYR